MKTNLDTPAKIVGGDSKVDGKMGLDNETQTTREQLGVVLGENKNEDAGLLWTPPAAQDKSEA